MAQLTWSGLASHRPLTDDDWAPLTALMRKPANAASPSRLFATAADLTGISRC